MKNILQLRLLVVVALCPDAGSSFRFIDIDFDVSD